MTTRTETKMVPQVETVYIAEDGTEFTTANRCQSYENKLQRKRGMAAIADIETCDALKNCMSFDGGLYYSEDDRTYWYRPKNEDEIEKLNDAFCGAYYRDFEASMIGKWLCVKVDSDDDLSSITTLDESIAYASDVLSELGYDLTVTKRGDDNEAH